MDSPDEKPEIRSDIRRKKLREYVRKHRGTLLAAALTVLRGWHETLVFAGLMDPGLTRE